MNTFTSIKRALISVSDKSQILELGNFLTAQGVEIWASGGTMIALKEGQIPCKEISEELNQPEMLDGRVKTLNSQIAAGILWRRESKSHQLQKEQFGFKSIDLIVCNFYPFNEAFESEKTFNECIEKIDIGGPTMVRAAVKNFNSVSVLTHPGQYTDFIKKWNDTNGKIPVEYNQNLATQAWQMLVEYDLKVQEFWLSQLKESVPNEIKYGENPQQKAWFSKQKLNFESLNPQTELSYNNILDLDSATRATKDLSKLGLNSTVIVKHGNPCGIGVSLNNFDSLKLAWESDPVSAFGGVIAVTGQITAPIAEFFTGKFIEVLAAPDFTLEALEILRKKPKIKIIKINFLKILSNFDQRSALGGTLYQVRDENLVAHKGSSVTKERFLDSQNNLCVFGEICVKSLKSNAVAVVREVGPHEFQLVAFGSGQTNRIDCITKLIEPKIKAKPDLDLKKCLVSSDAFFPFPDSIHELSRLGFKYVLQPGGSVKDSEVIRACNEHGIAMMTTGVRHFFH